MKETARHILKTVFGYDAFRLHQEEVIRTVTAGQDAFVLMPTGGGKSLCYQIPALLRPGTGVVISPLIALMRDQTDALAQSGIRARFINSSLSYAEIRRVEEEALSGQLDLLYAAPERLALSGFQYLLDRMPLSLIAIDEAHCVSAWGHDFRPEYLAIAEMTRRFHGRVPRIALTATAAPDTRQDILARLEMTSAPAFISSFDRPNIHYAARPRSGGMRQALDFIRNRHDGESGLIYCLTRKQTEQAAAALRDAGIPALSYHAGLSQAVRTETQRRFLREDGLVVAATVAFGMGIDKPDVRFVIHTGMPPGVEAYYQETGRAGRDGLPAEALLLYSTADLMTLRFIGEKGAKEADPRLAAVRRAKAEAMMGFCESVTCRRRLLLEALGEKTTADCGRCDICDEAPELRDMTEAARKLLSCIYRTGQNFGGEHIIDVLMGGNTAKIRRNGHDRVSTYGIGKDLKRPAWKAVLRRMRADGCLFPDPERGGGLALTPKSRAVLRGEKTIRMRADSLQRAPSLSPVSGRGSGGGHHGRPLKSEILNTPERAALWETLREKRLLLAKEQDVPPYVIFHDAVLLRLIQFLPRTPEEFLAVPGIGEKKCERLAPVFLPLLAEHAAVRGRPDSPLDAPDEGVGEPTHRASSGGSDRSDRPDRPDQSGRPEFRPTALITLELFQKGFDIPGIAGERGLSESTIAKHLTELILSGHIDAGEVLSLSAEERRSVEEIFRANGREEGLYRLKPVFEYFDGKYSYDVLRFIVSGMPESRS